MVTEYWKKINRYILLCKILLNISHVVFIEGDVDPLAMYVFEDRLYIVF